MSQIAEYSLTSAFPMYFPDGRQVTYSQLVRFLSSLDEVSTESGYFPCLIWYAEYSCGGLMYKLHFVSVDAMEIAKAHIECLFLELNSAGPPLGFRPVSLDGKV